MGNSAARRQCPRACPRHTRQTLYRRRRRVPLVLCARAAIRAFVLPLKLEKYVRLGARRFAITLLPLAERRFGVEREPVVTYARAACVSSVRQRALPDAVRDGWGSGQRANRATARRARGPGVFRLRPTVSSKSFRPGSPVSGETLRSKQLYFCAVASLAGGGGPRVLGRAGRLIEGSRFSISLFREETTMVERSVSTQKLKTITLNGGSLGSWVDEERS